MALTEEETIELTRSAFDAFNCGDFEAAMEFGNPEIVLARAGGLSEVRGAEALRAWMEPDAFASQKLDPMEIRVVGNKALINVRGSMRGAGSGIEMVLDAWSLWSFDEDGRVIRIENFLSHEEEGARRALEAP
jgi:SnoaL-like protein